MPPAPPLPYPAAQVRQYDRDRFVTALFAPPERRDDLFALYAFNLELAKLREVAREPMMGMIRLQWWRDTLAALAAGGGTPAHPVAGPLAEAMRRHDLDAALLHRLIDAREQDFAETPPDSLAALERYAEDSSAALTGLALQVLGASDADSRRAGRHLGIAWALIGLLRAVPFHAGLGRVALPADRLAAHGVAPEELLRGADSPGLRRAVEEIAGHAAGHLRQARSLRRAVAPAATPALLPGRLADAHLAALRRCGWNPFDPRCAAPRRRPLALAVAALLRRW